MKIDQASPETAGHPASLSSTTLRGHWLTLARLAWLGVALLTAGLFVAGVPLLFAELQTVCADPPCEHSRLTMDGVRDLQAFDLSIRFYAAYLVTLAVVSTVVFFAIAAVIFWRKSDEWMALFVSFFLVTLGVSFSVLAPV